MFKCQVDIFTRSRLNNKKNFFKVSKYSFPLTVHVMFLYWPIKLVSLRSLNHPYSSVNLCPTGVILPFPRLSHSTKCFTAESHSLFTSYTPEFIDLTAALLKSRRTERGREERHFHLLSHCCFPFLLNYLCV